MALGFLVLAGHRPGGAFLGTPAGSSVSPGRCIHRTCWRWSILFAAYVYGRRREVSELKTLLHDLHDRAGVTPSDEQLDQLTQVIQRSQRSFKELIDSFDDVAFACSLDGTLRTVNRRVTELLGLHYTDVVGHKIDEFLDGTPARMRSRPDFRAFWKNAAGRGWCGCRLKNSTRALYFDCVLNAIVKGDEVVGISALARDVTEEREKERRFTELFETLQEGVYFSTPEGQVAGCQSRTDANARLQQPGRAALPRSQRAQSGSRARVRCWAGAPTIAEASAPAKSRCGARMEPPASSSTLRAQSGTGRARLSATRARWWM